ncbi:MAG: sensor histidine kinase [Acidimicrobiales bacterium]
MRRRLDSVLPALVLMGAMVAALVVNLLLGAAQDRGVEALEASVTGEVTAIAGAQNQRFLNTFSGAAGLSGGLGGEPFELTIGSAADLEELEGLLELVANATSGFYLLDNDNQITQGVLLTRGALGSTFDWPGLGELMTTDAWTRGAVLPVSEGLTTDQPVMAFALPIYGELASGQPGPRRGTFVLEQVVAADSNFNKEIGQLRRGDTGRYVFFDDAGTVIASNDPASIGRPVLDGRLLTASAGLHRFDDRVVVIAEVPDAGWRVGFTQTSTEFEEALVGPLESAGQVIILVLLGSGVIVTLGLFRSLRAARAEQERLRALAEAQQEFISIVSHELRTPVAGVLGFLETSLDHWDVMDDVERRSAISRAAANARRLQAMTRDVLDTQSIESGVLVHVFTPLDLVAEARVAVAAALEQDPSRPIDLLAPESAVWVEADADRLQQVFANLIDNARKNSTTLDPIEITVRTENGMAEVAVSDRGPGIPEESMERIFERFVRGQGDSVTGTGLGLYISRQIITAHRGRIWVENDPGRGAIFRFSLPPVAAPAASILGQESKLL